ncbi:MAG: hypothetical protein ACJ8AG_03285 [Ktedonobacteraceae bacterium]
MLEKSEVYIASGWEKFAKDGSLTDETTRQQIQTLLESLVNAVDAQKYALAS